MIPRYSADSDKPCSHALRNCMMCTPSIGLQLTAAERGLGLLRSLLRLWDSGELAIDPEAVSPHLVEGTFNAVREYVAKPVWQPSALPVNVLLDQLFAELTERAQRPTTEESST